MRYNVTDGLTFWLNNAGKYPLLPEEVMINLSKTIQEHGADSVLGRRAVNKIVKHNLRLVPMVTQHVMASKRFGDKDTLDLLQAGTLGLTRAAQKFDYSRGYKFSTYAYAWIRQRVQRSMHAIQTLLHVPETYFRSQQNMANSSEFWKEVIAKGGKTYECNVSAFRAMNPMLSLKIALEDGDLRPRHDSSLRTEALEVTDSVEDLFNMTETPIEPLHKALVIDVCVEGMSIAECANKNKMCRRNVSNIIKRTLNRLRKAYKEGESIA